MRKHSRFEIRHDAGKIIFAGALRLGSRGQFESIMAELQWAVANAECELEIDCTGLRFLNSSALTMFSIFVQQIRDNGRCDRLVIRSNSSRYDWQARWLRNLRKVWGGVQVVDEHPPAEA